MKINSFYVTHFMQCIRVCSILQDRILNFTLDAFHSCLIYWLNFHCGFQVVIISKDRVNLKFCFNKFTICIVNYRLCPWRLTSQPKFRAQFLTLMYSWYSLLYLQTDFMVSLVESVNLLCSFTAFSLWSKGRIFSFINWFQQLFIMLYFFI